MFSFSDFGLSRLVGGDTSESDANRIYISQNDFGPLKYVSLLLC